MTAISRHAPQTNIAPALPPEPSLPRPVAHALACALAPVVGRRTGGDDDPGHYVAPPLLSPDQHAIAQTAAAQFDAMLDPVTLPQLAAWLMPVNAASRNPQSPGDFRLRVEGLFAMLDDLPAAAFTADTRRKLATGFFPSHEDIREAVEPIADQWRRKRDALKGLRVAEAPTSKGWQPPTDEERATVRAKVEALKAELAAKAAVRAPRDIKPRPLHPTHLLAEYEALAAAGNEAAAIRVAQLREALNA